jgi:hypothetical protein
VYVHTRTRTHARTHARTHRHTHRHTHAHTHIHTHARTLSSTSARLLRAASRMFKLGATAPTASERSSLFKCGASGNSLCVCVFVCVGGCVCVCSSNHACRTYAADARYYLCVYVRIYAAMSFMCKCIYTCVRAHLTPALRCT